MAERNPQVSDSWLVRPLTAATRAVLRRPVAALVIAVGLALVSVGLAATKLTLRTTRLDLISTNSDFNQLWLEFIKEFGDRDDAIVVAEGGDRDAIIAALGDLSKEIAREPKLFEDVLWRLDFSRLRSKGLHYLDANMLADTERFLRSFEPVLRGEWNHLKASHLLGGALQIESQLAAAAQQSPNAKTAERSPPLTLESVAISLNAAISDPPQYRSPLGEPAAEFKALAQLGPQYMLAKNGQIGFLVLRMADNKQSFNRAGEAIEVLRRMMQRVGSRHTAVKLGLTGLPVLEYDELDTSQRSMTLATLLSLFGVACLLLAGLGGVRNPIMTVGSLLLGLMWSFGYLTAAIGHLNLLSASFGSILVGMGIDFGIHYYCRYQQLRREGIECEPAMLQTTRGVGPGIVTGAVTTAATFLVSACTDFQGIVELGIIVGGGILLCAAAALFVLPPAISLVERNHPATHPPQLLSLEQWFNPLLKHPLTVLSVTLGLTVLGSFGITRLWYDYNLLNMQAEGLESVALEHRLLRDTGQSAWYAVSVAESRDELLAMKARYQQLPSVERTEEIVSLVPPSDPRKSAMIAHIGQQLANLPEHPPAIPIDDAGELLPIVNAADGFARQRQNAGAVTQLAALKGALAKMPPKQLYGRLAAWQEQFAGDLLMRVRMLASATDPLAPTFADLPENLVTRFVGKSGKHLLRIYGRGKLWDMEDLERFVRDVRTVDPRVTGNPLQTYECSLQVRHSYELAAVYSLLAILVFIYIDFRRIGDTCLAMLPTLLGIAQLFGLMGLFDIPLNPANLIVLPLLLGIGIDYGVHIVHDFRQCPGRYRIQRPVANAIMLSTTTSMVGFGALMISQHRGLQSFGRAMCLGVFTCMASGLIILPAILAFLTRHRAEIEEAGSDDARDADANSDEVTSREVSIGEVTNANAASIVAPSSDGVDKRGAAAVDANVAAAAASVELPDVSPEVDEYENQVFEDEMAVPMVVDDTPMVTLGAVTSEDTGIVYFPSASVRRSAEGDENSARAKREAA